jgi:predicted lipid-binding transport protein (Tim44 family)
MRVFYQPRPASTEVFAGGLGGTMGLGAMAAGAFGAGCFGVNSFLMVCL